MAELFWSLAVAAPLVVPLYAYRMRGRTYAIFGLVILALSVPGAVIAHARLRAWMSPPTETLLDLAFVWGMAAATTHLAALVQPRLRPTVFRRAVSIPGMTFIGAGFLSGLWLLALAPLRGFLGLLGADGVLHAIRGLDLAPFGVALASVVTSVWPQHEVVRVPLATEGPTEITRLPVERHRGRLPAPTVDRPLRIVQIADPHLGPWQSVRTLQRRIEALLAHEPDLVALTGDFLTMEGAATRGALAEALAPLRALPGRCVAIFGNHDHEHPDEVRHALAVNGVRLLLDEETTVDTPIGPVQLVGADWVDRDRRPHLHALLARFPRRPDHLRVLLLHDPSAFAHVPRGEVELTLSGHTHGGQLGLLSLGVDWTVLRRTRWPDHGLFAHGSNRLYVHRGTGFYGFPLRVGVPGEASLLEVLPARGGRDHIGVTDSIA